MTIPWPHTADGGLLPELAGARAFRRFCTPELSSCRSVDHDRLVERARFHLRQLESSGVQNLRNARAPASSGSKPPSAVRGQGMVMMRAEASSRLVRGQTWCYGTGSPAARRSVLSILSGRA